MSSPHILPDSRLSQRPDFGSKMVDWELANGGTVRCEAVMVYCANCGKAHGWVPKDNTSFAFYLCQKCYQTYGNIPGTWVQPDEEFNQAVKHEMEAKFGHLLTVEEIQALKEHDKLGTALTKLEKESPYPVPEHPVL